MLVWMPDELDEYGEALVTNPFADYNSTVSRSSNNHHNRGHVATALLDPSSENHPLVSPACLFPNIPLVTADQGEGKTAPWLTPPVSLDGSSSEVGEDRTTGSATSIPRSSDTIIHPVGQNDSFAGVALRYGTSIAALRRANQLWPSDPIHLRTELFIPRGDAPRARSKPPPGRSTHTPLQSAAEPTPDVSYDLVAFSFVAARDMILSVIPARISLDSLSSKATASEDHELDDLGTARRRKPFADEVPFSPDGVELAMLAAPPREPYKLPEVALSPQFPCTTTSAEHRHTHPSHISRIRRSRSQIILSSSAVSLERPPRRQPFAVLPVRTSQLAPEPAMELPVRRPRI